MMASNIDTLGAAPKAESAARLAARRVPRRSLPRALLLLSLLLPATLFAVAAWQSRSLMLGTAEAQAQDSLDILSQDTLKLFTASKFVAALVQERLGGGNWTAIESSAEFHRDIANLVRDMPPLTHVWVVDGAGWLHASSRDFPVLPVNIANDECVAALRSGEGTLCVSSRPRTPLVDKPAFDIVRRIAGAKGAFGGAVGLTLPPDYFARFYKTVVQNDRAVIGLVRSDGKVLAWSAAFKPDHPLPADADLMRAILHDPAGGTYVGATGVDGATRIVLYRQLEPYPVYAVIGVSRARVLAAWHGATLFYAVLAGLGALLMLAASYIVFRRLRRDRMALEQGAAQVRALEERVTELGRMAKMRSFREQTDAVARDR